MYYKDDIRYIVKKIKLYELLFNNEKLARFIRNHCIINDCFNFNDYNILMNYSESGLGEFRVENVEGVVGIKISKE